MKELIDTILNEYLQAKTENFAQHPIGKTIKTDLVNDFNMIDFIDCKQYKVDASAGKGRWALVPWLCIYDRDICLSASEGYYIAYLFRSDMSGFYLSLNQGWTYYHKNNTLECARRNISIISGKWRSILKTPLSDFTFDPIDLVNANTLAKGYEMAHICGKFYDAGLLPTEQELRKDLSNMLGVYRELKGHLNGKKFSVFNEELLINSLNVSEGNNSIDELDLINNEIEHYTVEVVDTIKLAGITEKKSFTARIVDFEHENRRNQKIGEIGESIVIEFEKQFLFENGRADLANRVLHASKTLGDGAGYDILSFTLDGNEKYIEVKTTISNNNSNFYITDNELQFSKQNSDNFYLYRVMNIKSKIKSATLYISKGNMEEKFKLKATSYIAYSNIE